MNKSELVDAIAADAEISKAAANRAIDAFVAAVTKSLGKGEDVTLIGFGTFTVGERAARTGRNPRTGEEIKIKATKFFGVVFFCFNLNVRVFNVRNYSINTF